MGVFSLKFFFSEEINRHTEIYKQKHGVKFLPMVRVNPALKNRSRADYNL